MIKSFFGHNHPLITALLQSKTKEGLLSEISLCLQEGADAIGLQLETLPASMRGEAVLSELFGAAGDVPIYVTCYECDDLVAEDDDARAATLLRALYCGATMADIRCDMFCPSPYEMTDDPIAVGKQMALADEIHTMNKEVLFSCHVRNGRFFRFLTSKEVIALANEQKKRGADMAKIVTRADTDNELSENFETIIRLRKEVSIPTLFLCNGNYALRHRLGGALVYEPMVFAREDSITNETITQGPISTYKALFRAAGFNKE